MESTIESINKALQSAMNSPYGKQHGVSRFGLFVADEKVFYALSKSVKDDDAKHIMWYMKKSNVLKVCSIEKFMQASTGHEQFDVAVVPMNGKHAGKQLKFAGAYGIRGIACVVFSEDGKMPASLLDITQLVKSN